MISDNTKGNKYHDESGKFTSGSNASEKSEKKQYVPKKSGSSDFATEWLKSLTEPMKEESPEVTNLLNMLKKMNAVGEEETGEEKDDPLFSELEKGDYVNIDSGLLPYEHGIESSGSEDLAVDARKTPEGKYEVYMYLETEDGPVAGMEPTDNEPNYVFDSYDELKEFIDGGYKMTSKETEEKLGEMGFGESEEGGDK